MNGLSDFIYTRPKHTYHGINEALVEQAVLELLQELGWRYEDLADIAPDGPDKRRTSNGEVILPGLLEEAARRINPHFRKRRCSRAALKQVQVTQTPCLIAENRRIHSLLVVGIDVEYRHPDGSIKGDKLRLIDFADLANNDLMVTNQFTVFENCHNRRPDAAPDEKARKAARALCRFGRFSLQSLCSGRCQ